MRTTLLILGVALLFQGSPSNGPTTPTRVSPLFNGRDLSGWTADVPEKDTNPQARDSFIVRNGMLVSLGTPPGHLLTTSSYQNYRLEVTNPGGHSSRPVKNNAIYHLAAGLIRIGAYDFPVQFNEANRAYFTGMAKIQASKGETAVADAMNCTSSTVRPAVNLQDQWVAFTLFVAEREGQQPLDV